MVNMLLYMGRLSNVIGLFGEEHSESHNIVEIDDIRFKRFLPYAHPVYMKGKSHRDLVNKIIRVDESGSNLEGPVFSPDASTRDDKTDINGLWILSSSKDGYSHIVQGVQISTVPYEKDRLHYIERSEEDQRDLIVFDEDSDEVSRFRGESNHMIGDIGFIDRGPVSVSGARDFKDMARVYFQKRDKIGSFGDLSYLNSALCVGKYDGKTKENIFIFGELGFGDDRDFT